MARRRHRRSLEAGPRVLGGRRGHCHGPRHCEAAKPPKQSSRAVRHVMGGRPTAWPCPILDCFALACARARNDGGAAVPRVMGGRRRHRRGHRHCEAAKPPKQSRRAVRHVMGGRRTVLPRRFWIASRSLALALAMTVNRFPRPGEAARPSAPGPHRPLPATCRVATARPRDLRLRAADGEGPRDVPAGETRSSSPAPRNAGRSCGRSFSRSSAPAPRSWFPWCR
jgi:hypothetical protein